MKNVAKAKEYQKLAITNHDPKDSRIALSYLFKSLHADPTYALSMMGIASIFFNENFRDAAITYAKRAVLHAPDDETIWQGFSHIVNELFQFSDDLQINDARQQEILNFLNSGFATQRRQMTDIPSDCVLIRMHNKSKYATTMLEQGVLYFSPTKIFRETPDEARKDVNENKPHKIKLVDSEKPISPKGERVEFLGGTISIEASPDAEFTIYESSIEAGGFNKVCCFTLVHEENVKEFLKEYQGNFGDDAVIITNVPKFERRVRTSLTSEDLSEIKSGQVTYVPQEVIDNCMHGVFEPYVKGMSYKHEFEFRFSFNGGGNQAKGYPVGSLKDIAEIIAGSEVKDWIKSRFNIDN